MLRLIVLILLLLNIGYFAWGEGWLLAYGWGPTPQREPHRLAQQVHPEAIVVLTDRESPPAPAPESAASAAANVVCLLSSALDETQVQALQPLLTAHLTQGGWSLDEQTTPARWIIYMGRFTNPTEQASKRAQLNELKIAFEAVDVPGLSPGFALGTFTTRTDTESALQALNKRGVRTAKMTQIETASTRYHLRLPALDPTLPVLQTIRDAVPDMVLQPCATPAANPATGD